MTATSILIATGDVTIGGRLVKSGEPVGEISDGERESLLAAGWAVPAKGAAPPAPTTPNEEPPTTNEEPPPPDPFAALPAKTRDLLAAQDPPITTPDGVRAYIAAHGSLTKITGIGPASAAQILAAIDGHP